MAASVIAAYSPAAVLRTPSAPKLREESDERTGVGDCGILKRHIVLP